MRQLAKKEILNFLLYLSASDGSIEVAEALFIKDYLSEQISPEEMCQRIEEDNIYSSAFEQRISLTLKRLVKLDNSTYEKKGELEESDAEKYICGYEALGKEFIACDHEVSQSERDDLSTYITNMRSFYCANYKGPDEATKAAHSEHTVDTSRNQKKRNSVEGTDEEEESLESLINQLNAMVGLEKVKGTVSQLIYFNTIRQIRDERGLVQMPMTQHMVFYGNPGTGKTTVARMIAKIYHHLGLLSKGHLVEVNRSGLVAGYVGHTVLKVKDVVKQAKGGVLFIDEAYALTYKRSENDFGWEAVDTLIKVMEDDFALTKNILVHTQNTNRRLYRQLKNSISIRIDKKLAAKLYRIGKEFGVCNGEWTLLNVNLTITYIADMLGCKRESLSRAMKILQDENLVKIEGKKVYIKKDELSSYFKST